MNAYIPYTPETPRYIDPRVVQNATATTPLGDPNGWREIFTGGYTHQGRNVHLSDVAFDMLNFYKRYCIIMFFVAFFGRNEYGFGSLVTAAVIVAAVIAVPLFFYYFRRALIRNTMFDLD